MTPPKSPLPPLQHRPGGRVLGIPQIGTAQGGLGGSEGPHPPDESRTFRISFLRSEDDIICLMGVCPGRTMSRSASWVNFTHRHVQETVVILEGGGHPLPRCPKCDIFVTWRAINGRHQSPEMYARGEERSRKHCREEEARGSTAAAFQAYGRPLEAALEFKYIGGVLTALYDNLTAVVVKLRKAWRRWARMSSILGREGEYPCTSSKFYKAMVQATLLFGAETWVMYPKIGRTLGGFHHRVALCLEKMQLRRYMTGRWV